MVSDASAYTPMFKTTTENFNGFLSRRFRPAWISAVSLACSAGLVGCAMFQRATPEDSQERLQTLEVERDQLKQQIDNRDRDVARLQLESLAQDARIQKLEATLQRREQELGQARERLQRVETRIQSLRWSHAEPFAQSEIWLQNPIADFPCQD